MNRAPAKDDWPGDDRQAPSAHTLVRVLAVSDEVVPFLWTPAVRDVGAELIVACGDLPAEYLEYLVTVANVPVVFVPGNHDTGPHPSGCLNLDGRMTTIGGLRVGGLGGSMRYRPGPNQYTERQMRGRARALARRCHGSLDLLITHAPLSGVGDGDDLPHRGFNAFIDLINVVHPKVMVHGHVHPYGPRSPDRHCGDTVVINVVPRRVFELSRSAP